MPTGGSDPYRAGPVGGARSCGSFQTHTVHKEPRNAEVEGNRRSVVLSDAMGAKGTTEVLSLFTDWPAGGNTGPPSGRLPIRESDRGLDGAIPGLAAGDRFY